MNRFLLLFTACFAPIASPLAAADWDRFRGPNGGGINEAGALPAEFGPAKNLLWKTALPPGHSSPVVSRNRIFLTAFEGDTLLTIALDRATGKIAWRREAPRTRKHPVDKRNSPASPSAVADGRNVWVFFADYGLVSYGWDGNERWRLPLGPFNNTYGMGASPILADDKIVLVCDQSGESFIVAVGKDDGKIRWKTPRPEALSGHSTPIVWKDGARTQIVAPASFRMDSYDAATGQVAWFVNGLTSEMKSTPVLAGGVIYINGFNTPENDPGKQVYVPPWAEVLAKNDLNKDGKLSLEESPRGRVRSFFRYVDTNQDQHLDAPEWRLYEMSQSAENGLLAVKPGGKGDVTGTAIRWKYHRSIPQLPSTLIYQGVLYMINDNGVLTTLDPTTGVVFRQARLRGVSDSYYASPVAADGKIFIVSLSGVASVLKAGPEQELIKANELEDEVYATPAIIDGRILIRTRNALYAFGLDANARP